MTVTLGKLRRGEAINFDGRPDRPRTKLLDFESMPSGKLLGWARVLAPPWTINDVGMFVGQNGRPYAALPAKPVLEAGGSHKGGVNGKRQYLPVLELPPDLRSRFSDTVVALVLETYSGVLDERSPQS
jgi:hypothetical protein